MVSIISPESFYDLEQKILPYNEEPAGPYVQKLVAEPHLEPSTEGAPFPPAMRVESIRSQPISVVYSKLVGIARGTYRASKQTTKQTIDMSLYKERKRWLGRVARECGDSLLLQAGLFPEALITTRPRRGFWAPDYKSALWHGPLFYELATRFDGLEEAEGRDLSHNFNVWVDRLHTLKQELNLWAREITTLLRLEELGIQAYPNVVLIRR